MNIHNTLNEVRKKKRARYKIEQIKGERKEKEEGKKTKRKQEARI